MKKTHMLYLIWMGLIFFGIPANITIASESLLYVTGPCYLKFPQDHGPHDGFRTEWWYYTGNVFDEQGLQFGFQLTFFRSRIIDEPINSTKRPEEISAWRTPQLILAHAALTKLSEKKHYQAEKMAREALDIAGASLQDDMIQVHIENWSMKLRPEKHLIKADTQDFSFEFTLVPSKKPVLHGNQGYVQKGRHDENASCYYSFTRLKARGHIRVGSKLFEVDGYAWMDHEFGTNQLGPDLVGWDWFSIQLDNQTELMVYFLRKKDGSYSKFSSGTFVMKSGDSIHLIRENMQLQKISAWKSKATGGIYPYRWILRVPKIKLTLEIEAVLADQEMITPETTRVTYWEGSVSAKGLKKGKTISGKGYAELTGYVEPLNVPM